VAAEAPAAHRAEEGCNPPPAILPDTPGAGIAGVIAGIIAEIIPGIIAAFTRHLRGRLSPAARGDAYGFRARHPYRRKGAAEQAAGNRNHPLPEFVPAGVKS
jgi:hypothetical protein